MTCPKPLTVTTRFLLLGCGSSMTPFGGGFGVRVNVPGGSQRSKDRCATTPPPVSNAVEKYASPRRWMSFGGKRVRHAYSKRPSGRGPRNFARRIGGYDRQQEDTYAVRRTKLEIMQVGELLSQWPAYVANSLRGSSYRAHHDGFQALYGVVNSITHCLILDLVETGHLAEKGWH